MQIKTNDIFVTNKDNYISKIVFANETYYIKDSECQGVVDNLQEQFNALNNKIKLLENMIIDLNNKLNKINDNTKFN